MIHPAVARLIGKLNSLQKQMPVSVSDESVSLSDGGNGEDDEEIDLF